MVHQDMIEAKKVLWYEEAANRMAAVLPGTPEGVTINTIDMLCVFNRIMKKLQQEVKDEPR